MANLTNSSILCFLDSPVISLERSKCSNQSYLALHLRCRFQHLRLLLSDYHDVTSLLNSFAVFFKAFSKIKIAMLKITMAIVNHITIYPSILPPVSLLPIVEANPSLNSLWFSNIFFGADLGTFLRIHLPHLLLLFRLSIGLFLGLAGLVLCQLCSQP